jgi:hypothetical protein
VIAARHGGSHASSTPIGMPSADAASTPIAQRVSDASAWPSSVLPLNGSSRVHEARDDLERRRQHAREHHGPERGGEPTIREQRRQRERAVAHGLRDAAPAQRRGAPASPLRRPRRNEPRQQLHADREARAQEADDAHRDEQDAHLERARRIERDVAKARRRARAARPRRASSTRCQARCARRRRASAARCGTRRASGSGDRSRRASCAARTSRPSIEYTACIEFITHGTIAAMKTTKTRAASPMPSHRIASGIHASGGIGTQQLENREGDPARLAPPAHRNAERQADEPAASQPPITTDRLDAMWRPSVLPR